MGNIPTEINLDMQVSSGVELDFGGSNVEQIIVVEQKTPLANGSGLDSLIMKGEKFNNIACNDAAIALGDGNTSEGRKSITIGTQNHIIAYEEILVRPLYKIAAADENICYFDTKAKKFLPVNTIDEIQYHMLDKVYQYFSAQGNSSIGVGQVNIIRANCAGAFGNGNELGVNAANSYVFGRKNYLDSYRSFIAGHNNRGEKGKYNQHILGENNTAKNDHEYLIGYGLLSSTVHQVVLGKNNAEQSDALVIVGCGADENNRKNCFYITHCGAYDVNGKLSNASNLRNGDAVGSIVGIHTGNETANKAIGIGSIAGGSVGFWQADNTKVTGTNSIGWGYKVEVGAAYSFGLGWGIKLNNSERKIAYGIYNEDKTNTVFEIGAGSGDNSRKNIFEITTDGIVKFDKLTDGKTTKTVSSILAGGGGGEIADNSITTAKLDNGAVTTLKIANEAITYDKLGGSIKPVVSDVMASFQKGNGTPVQIGAIVNELGAIYRDTTTGDIYIGIETDEAKPYGTWEKLVKKTDYATSETAGVVSIWSGGGLSYNKDNGRIFLAPANNNQISTRTTDRAPITIENLDKAVRAVLTVNFEDENIKKRNIIPLSDTEKAKAREFIGIEKRYKHTVGFVGVKGYFEIVSTIETSLIEAFLEDAIPEGESIPSHTQVPNGFLESIKSFTYYDPDTLSTSNCLIMIGETFAENCIKSIYWCGGMSGGEEMLRSTVLPMLNYDTVTEL